MRSVCQDAPMAPPRTLAVVMAGGAGSRLGLLTERRAKPVIPVGGGYRLIDITLSNCAHSGIGDVWIVQQELPASLEDALGNGRPWDLDRSTGGLRTLPPSQGNARSGPFTGTADALWKVATLVREFEPEALLVMSADAIYRLDYHEVVAGHLESGAAMTMVTTEVPEPTEASRLAVVEVDGAGTVTSFEYKPDDPSSTLVSNEIFVFDPVRTLDRLDAIAVSSGGDGDTDVDLENLQDQLVPSFVDDNDARAHRFDGYWRDVGTIDSYWSAHMDLAAEQPPFDFDDERWPMLSAGQRHRTARLRSSSSVTSSLVAGGCDVAGKITRSVLSVGVTVERGAHVDRSVLRPGVIVRSGATVRRTVVDAGVTIGRDCDVGGARGGIAVVGNAMTVRKGTRIVAGEQRPLRR